MRSASVLHAGVAALAAAALVACGLSLKGGETSTTNDTAPDATAAPDASAPETSTDIEIDGGTGPVSFDLTPFLDVDVVLNRADGGYDQMQSTVDGSNYVLLTQSAENALFGTGSTGLPDDGFFPANADHPDLRLALRNDDFGLNARRLSPGFSVTIPLPPRSFERLQVIGISTEGTTTQTATIRYTDDTRTLETITFADWYAKQAGPGAFLLAGRLDRASINDPANPFADTSTRGFAVSGLNLRPDPGRIAKDLTITCTSTERASTRFHLLGVAGD